MARSPRNIEVVPEQKLQRRLADLEAVPPRKPVGWANATLLNTWENFEAAGWGVAAYRKDSGIVFLRGLVKKAAGATNTAILTLPEGCRPTKQMMFATWSAVPAEQASRVDVKSNGEVVWVGVAAPGFVSISDISFRAEQ